MNLREEIKKVVLLPLRSWAHEYMPDKEAEKEIKKRIDELVKIAYKVQTTCGSCGKARSADCEKCQRLWSS